MQICFKNAHQVDAVTLTERALHYGDGCFSTVAVIDDVILMAQRHMQRLQFGAARLMLQLDMDLIQRSLTQLRAKYGVLNGSLKMLISRGEGQRGYSFPDHAADFYLFYYPSERRELRAEYINSGVLQAQMGLKTPQLVGVKSLNCLEQVLFKHEADQQGWPEALLTDLQQHVVEGVSSNCFLYIDGQWVSPILQHNGVHGVMRDEILQRMQKIQLNCQLRHVHIDEINHIQSLFFCNALAPMKIVQKLHQCDLATQPCVELFQSLQLNQLNTYAEN